MNLVEIYTNKKGELFVTIMDTLMKSEDPYTALATMLRLSNGSFLVDVPEREFAYEKAIDNDLKTFNAMFRGIF